MTIIRECPICIEQICNIGYVVTDCGHYYCLKCFIEHIQSKTNTSIDCPMCRNVIVKRNVIETPNIIDMSDDDTPITVYISDIESNSSSDDEPPRLMSDTSDDNQDESEDDSIQRYNRIRSR
tara:strand:+ start:52 stop:417 length:366 start_codon:yes stop_codon:yes gene_type:complete